MINGILNIKKEKGFTSHDVVAKLRGILHQKKIGHTGTLDPDAEGVLPVCLGKATRLCDRIGDWDKTYVATLLLGKTTDTEDISGMVLEEKPVTVNEENVRDIIASFVGDYEQIPPMYSAKKVGGKKLYELAREGIVIERKSCPVTIFAIDIQEINLPRVTFSVHCSKGTYIRSLCRDIGEKAGCGGCMETLIRTQVAFFDIREALTIAEVETFRDKGELLDYIRSIDSVFTEYPSVCVSQEAEKKLYNGNPIPWTTCVVEDYSQNNSAVLDKDSSELYRVYDKERHFIGIYKKKPGSRMLHPDKLFFDMP